MEDSKETSYFDWLTNQIDNDYISYNKEKFIKTALLLNEIEFTYFVPNDDNRAADGIALREKFKEETGSNQDFGDMPCSVLEMMIALAMRCERDIMGDENNPLNRTYLWFWCMLVNLKINDCDEETLRKRVSKMLKRTYGKNGNGGLFPLKNPPKDQRNTEIWYQMSFWLQENYPVTDDFE